MADPSGMEVVPAGGRFAGQDGLDPILFPQDRRRIPLRRGIAEIDVGGAPKFRWCTTWRSLMIWITRAAIPRAARMASGSSPRYLAFIPWSAVTTILRSVAVLTISPIRRSISRMFHRAWSDPGGWVWVT